jgi:recombinase-like zinc beta ribbon protein
LKDTVFCAYCGASLCLTKAKGQYLYFFWVGTQQHRSPCRQLYIPAIDIEEAVERFYRSVRLPEEVQGVIRAAAGGFVLRMESSIPQPGNPSLNESYGIRSEGFVIYEEPSTRENGSSSKGRIY